MGCITIAMCCLIQNLFVEALHHQTAAPKLIDPATLVNREVSELLSEVLSGISKSRAAFSKCCCTACQGGRLLTGDAAPDLKVAGCFPKMPPSISESPTTSPKCCTASQGRRLLPGDAAPDLKVASCFPTMPPTISKSPTTSRKCCTASQ